MKDVLLVDDETAFLNSLKDGLSSFGSGISNVIMANNGKKAIEILKTVAVDVVVTDLRMPVMDGYAILEYLRQKLPDTPVIVMTAFSEGDVGDRLKHLRIDHIAEKPLDFREIAGRILTA
jgi:YesN/AraC family two-component response regulator